MIIAECCTNWSSLTEAHEMIRVAKQCGAGLAKFQLFDAEDDLGKPHYDWVKAHEITYAQAKELFRYGASIGMEVFFSVFGVEYVEWCERIGVKRYKIAAGMRDADLLRAVEATEKAVVVSGGVKNGELGWRQIEACLYCPSDYPQRVVQLQAGQFRVWQGFSDHTIGLDAAKIALARNARIIEKHFVLEHNSAFPDDAWSMTPDGLRELVRWEKVCREVT